MKKHNSCKSCLVISYLFTLNLVVSAQEKSFYKSIINDPIKLDFSQIEAKADDSSYRKDSVRIVTFKLYKDQLITPTYNYGFNILYSKDFERLSSTEDTVLKISPDLLTPFTNPKSKNNSERPVQLEYMHGDKQMVPRPNYRGRGSDLSNPPKSYRQRKKEKVLKYITTVVYPTDSTKIE